MDKHTLWSLRLGFSGKESEEIEKKGIEKFLSNSFGAESSVAEPAWLKGTPRTLEEFKALKAKLKSKDKDVEKSVKEFAKTALEMKAWWVERMHKAEYPLREKMTLFWQNHFVATLQSVKVPYWIFQHYQILHEQAFGNYKTLVKSILYSNALLKYLDNNQNRKGKINENLGRELLELFTLGEGHYTEEDVKNTAMALAGLTAGDKGGAYRPFLMDKSNKLILGKSGNFIIDDVVDIIFEQENTPYFITNKLLKWFIYDNPPADLVTEYGSKLKAMNYELRPFLAYVFEKEFNMATAGAQLKSPLVFSLQMMETLKLEQVNYKLVSLFLRTQGMDLFDQPNVKGWQGGKSWLMSQVFLQRNQFSDLLTTGNKALARRLERQLDRFEVGDLVLNPQFRIDKKASAKQIIDELCGQLIFERNEEMNADLNALLKYDFEPGANNARESILRVYGYLFKIPEFHII